MSFHDVIFLSRWWHGFVCFRRLLRFLILHQAISRSLENVFGIGGEGRRQRNDRERVASIGTEQLKNIKRVNWPMGFLIFYSLLFHFKNERLFQYFFTQKSTLRHKVLDDKTIRKCIRIFPKKFLKNVIYFWLTSRWVPSSLTHASRMTPPEEPSRKTAKPTAIRTNYKKPLQTGNTLQKFLHQFNLTIVFVPKSSSSLLQKWESKIQMFAFGKMFFNAPE